jgi:lysophospholipase L1-like esterase
MKTTIPSSTVVGYCIVAFSLLAANSVAGDNIRDKVRGWWDEIRAGKQPDTRPLNIVHLGDSYSAGNAAEDYGGVPDCYRSSNNWGSVLSDKLEANKHPYAVRYRNRACSGAVIRDFTQRKKMKHKRGCERPTYYSEEEECDADGTRYIKPQIEFLSKDVDLVLMTVGGNDLNFADIVRDCFGLGFYYNCMRTVNSSREKLTNYTTDLTALFKNIREMISDDAKILIPSYPHITIDVPYKLWRHFFCFWCSNNYPFVAEIRQLAIDGDKAQREAIAAANSDAGSPYIIYFNKTKKLFSGHEPNPYPVLWKVLEKVLWWKRNSKLWILECEGWDPSVSFSISLRCACSRTL